MQIRIFKLNWIKVSLKARPERCLPLEAIFKVYTAHSLEAQNPNQ